MSFPDTTRHADETDIIYPGAIPFALIHLACFAVIWTGFQALDLMLCGVLYAIRMFAITGGYHRYFSHRSFKTSRVFQFLLAFVAQSSTQQGALWWAAHHRKHHKYSDTPQDVHSPLQSGFWFAHFGWIFSATKSQADYDLMRDFMKFPELVWLNKYKHVPPVLLGVGVWLVSGWSGLVVGFFISTMLLFHCTFAINSLAHLIGKQSYVTGDDSRNNWFLALITFGEGWHNNHHYFQGSTRQGFHWWQIDFTYYVLKFLRFLELFGTFAPHLPPQFKGYVECHETSWNESPNGWRRVSRLKLSVSKFAKHGHTHPDLKSYANMSANPGQPLTLFSPRFVVPICQQWRL